MLTYEIAKNIFNYDMETGKLTWLSRRRNGIKIGDEVGTVVKNGKNYYRRTNICGNQTQVHRIIWLMHYREWPKGVIDYIDGNGLNNKIENLRDVNPVDNSRNQRFRLDNKTGCSGIYFDTARNKYVVRVSTKFIGRFKLIEDAIFARKNAAKNYGFHENHGANREIAT